MKKTNRRLRKYKRRKTRRRSRGGMLPAATRAFARRTLGELTEGAIKKSEPYTSAEKEINKALNKAINPPFNDENANPNIKKSMYPINSLSSIPTPMTMQLNKLSK
jgi:hypothetical protein